MNMPGSRGARDVTVSSAAHIGVSYNLMVIVQEVVKRKIKRVYLGLVGQELLQSLQLLAHIVVGTRHQ